MRQTGITRTSWFSGLETSTLMIERFFFFLIRYVSLANSVHIFIWRFSLRPDESCAFSCFTRHDPACWNEIDGTNDGCSWWFVHFRLSNWSVTLFCWTSRWLVRNSGARWKLSVFQYEIWLSWQRKTSSSENRFSTKSASTLFRLSKSKLGKYIDESNLSNYCCG